MDSYRDCRRQPSREELLYLDIDTRVAELWPVVWREKCDEVLVGALIRTAYGLGYRDALIERPRARLYVDHGYDVPRPPRQLR